MSGKAMARPTREFHRRLTSFVDAYLTNRCKSWRSEIVLFNLPTRWFVFDDMSILAHALKLAFAGAWHVLHCARRGAWHVRLCVRRGARYALGQFYA